MKQSKFIAICGVLALLISNSVWFASYTNADTQKTKFLENKQYKVQLLDDASVEITCNGHSAFRFEPNFTVLYSSTQVLLTSDRISNPYYRVIAWQKSGNKEKTKDLFKAAQVINIKAVQAKQTANQLSWIFPEHPLFSLRAELSVPDGKGEPQIRFQFVPKNNGWYSIGYTGAPEMSLAKIDSLWQPLMWCEKRLPEESYLTEEARCTIPAAMVSVSGQTFSVVVEPTQIPYRMPGELFGVAVRNSKGNVQPMAFAPILGGQGSKMETGKPFNFKVLLLVYPGDFSKTFEYAARNIFSFRDCRVNTLCTLNQTLDNMIDYAMGPWARFDEKAKGSCYDQDVAGGIKNVSPLHPLGVSIVTDDEDIFLKRVWPMTEYVLSREKFLFKAGDKPGQGSSNKMTGPCAPVSELASLYRMSNYRTPVFLHLVKELYQVDRTLNMEWVTKGGTWQMLLAVYRATGDRKYLDDAVAKANSYISQRIDKPQYDFKEAGTGTFWDYMYPAWKDLFELYEETGNPKFLDAAAKGAREYASLVWFYPPIPDKNIVVNKGGVAPTRGHRNAPPIKVPQETVPAWRTSEVGLICEGNGTAARLGIFLATHAPYFLRLAHYTNDEFLRDIGRSAIIGRYSNFPGYHMNTEYTTVFEKLDFPFRPLKEFTITSMHYNHIWPQVAFVLDYLITDAFDRSDGKIDFPSEYVEAYAYLQSKVYGDKPGKFYDDKNVRLWMPKKLVSVDNVQANYIACYGNGNFYLAMLNQCNDNIKVSARLNQSLLPDIVGKTYNVRVYKDNKPAEPSKLDNGKINFDISKKGITALVVEGLKVSPKFQQKIIGGSEGKAWKNGYAALDFGGTRAMILDMGPQMRRIYIYLQAADDKFKKVSLHYAADDQWKTISDDAYPFEFSINLPPEVSQFKFKVEGISPSGESTISQESVLSQQ